MIVISRVPHRLTWGAWPGAGRYRKKGCALMPATPPAGPGCSVTKPISQGRVLHIETVCNLRSRDAAPGPL
jgi:hypothetical protein